MIEYYIVYKGSPNNQITIGLLAYDCTRDFYSMYINTSLINSRCYPLLFGIDGKSYPNDYIIRAWIDSRTMPEDRIGIEKVLKALNLTEYNGWEILKAAEGRNPGCDDWGFKQTDSPDVEYVSKLVWERGGRHKRPS